MRDRELEDRRRNKEEIYILTIALSAGSSNCSPILSNGGNGISEGETDIG
jgi:hypothetical protein